MPKKAFSLSHKTVALLCAVGLILSLLPVYALSFYNHPFYDDFGFSIRTHAAWRDTGSLVNVLKAAWENTVGIRQTWEGTYASSFISSLQPGIFGAQYYFLATLVLLTALLFSTGFFLKQALGRCLKASQSALIASFCALAFVMVQFVPSPSEAFFWFNGGVAYTLMWCFFLFTAGLWLRLEQTESRPKAIGLFIGLVPLTVIVGGGKYSTLLLALLLALCFTLWAFVRRRPNRGYYAVLTVLLLGCLIFNATAPGNAVRAKTLHGGMSAPMAIAQSLYFGLALMGRWFSLPLVAALGLVGYMMLPCLRGSGRSFKHPLWITGLSLGLFCAQLTPTLFTGNYLGDGRTLNTYYYTYVLMNALLMVYWLGWGLERMNAKPELGQAEGAGLSKGAGQAKGESQQSRAKGAVLLLLAAVLALGCLSYSPDGAESYGPQNMASGSAVRSLITGEAKRYDQDMDLRDAAMNDPTLTQVQLSPVSTVPKVFMTDALDSDSLDYVLSLYAEYYDKISVTVSEKE